MKRTLAPADGGGRRIAAGVGTVHRRLGVAATSQLSFDENADVTSAVAQRLGTHETRREPSTRETDGQGVEVSVDQVLAWVAQRQFSDEALGYALRRLAERGSVEQIIAFSVALHATHPARRRP